MGLQQVFFFSSNMNSFLVSRLGLLICILLEVGSGLRCYEGFHPSRELETSELEEVPCDGICSKQLNLNHDDEVVGDQRHCISAVEVEREKAAGNDYKMGCENVKERRDGKVIKHATFCRCKSDLCNGISGLFPATFFTMATLLISKAFIE